VKEFQEDVDYKVLLTQTGKQRGGHNKKTYLMNVATFEGFCMAAHTEKGKQTRKYFRKMANIIKEHIKNQLQIQSEQLKQKELEYQKQIQAKEQELLKYKEKTYEEIEKTGHLYVIKTDGGTKVGKTKDCVSKRIKGLQTGNVNNIEIILDYPTCNADLLEKNVHFILERYRCNSNREFFDCNIDFIKKVVQTCGKVIDTLKSCYHHISDDEFVSKLKECHIEIHHFNEEEQSPQSINSFHDWLDNFIVSKHDGILNLKDVCELYLGKTVSSRISCRYKTEIENYIKKHYKGVNELYKDTSYNGEKVKGWVGMSLKS
jgi:phage anti-repressor protein